MNEIPSGPGPAGGAELSLAETTRRLGSEFADSVDPPAISAVVRACCADLAGSPPAALPELVERLAREDLADLALPGRGHPPPRSRSRS